ncbi:hypothetical protein HZS_7694 [Henneguya salminicola]|nr:hypothetical protein HZS_7694 [Henneguya salminicola]
MNFLLLLLLSIIYISNEHGKHEQHNHKQSHHKEADLRNSFMTFVRKIPGSSPILSAFESTAHHLKKMNVLSQILLAVGFISTAPIIFLIFIPVSNNENTFLLKLMVAFAAGCLLGDSFLHLIPHTYEEHRGLESEIGSYILLGIFMFYFIEKTLNHFKYQDIDEKSKVRQKLYRDLLLVHAFKDSKLKKILDLESLGKDVQDPKQISHGVILNLIADIVHNFMDGMAIASTFMIDPITGLTSTISIFFHEIPHELSDFAILIKSGFTPLKAIMLQFVTAAGAFAGAIVTWYLGKALGDTHSHIIPSLTAGGFIYISCVNIIPDILSKIDSAKNFLAESTSILVGVLVFTFID